jgi:hypothetical protein
MGQGESNLGCEEFGLILGEHAHLDQMAEELTTLDKFHKEVNSVIVLEDIFHINQERMVNLAQNIFLELYVFHLLILKNNVFTDALHGIKFARCGVLNKIDFSKGALSDHLPDLEVLKRGRCLIGPSVEGSCAASHRLSDLIGVRVCEF